MAVFFIENYGCQMNTAEADSLRGVLAAGGHEEAGGPEGADVVIINTCSVRKTAEARIVGRLGFYRGLMEQTGRRVNVVLMGCMAQNSGAEMLKRFPDVLSGLWGTYNKDGILEYLDSLGVESVGGPESLQLQGYHFMDAGPQAKYPFKSFVPISHGCDNCCTYCIVPFVRGREVCRDSAAIIENIKRLAGRGVIDFTLLGQNVNSYRNPASGDGFADLLSRIAAVDGIKRLSFLTSHPADFTKDIADVILANGNILRTVHLPVQSGSDRVLERMNRRYTSGEYLRKMEWLKAVPGMLVTTDILVGFPGETEKEFQETLSLVEKVRFLEAFMYQYNVREGTEAASYEGQVPHAAKIERLTRLIGLQNGINRRILAEQKGMRTTALVEAVSRKSPGELTARTAEGMMVFIKGTAEMIGTIVPVEIGGVSGAGLKGRVAEGFKNPGFL